MTRKELLAYLAGAIDSDGTIGVKKSTYAMRHRQSGGASYSERLALRQVQRDIPELLRDTFGGGLYITKPYAKNGKPLWSWAATDKVAFNAIVALLPYLRVKKRQAENAIRLRRVKDRSLAYRTKKGPNRIGCRPRSAHITALMDQCYDRAKTLNRVGI